uniref:Uncharacterized protein n=1 Tax=Chelydra serpentina TaxID=8475 RepID=A0A8C3SES2_CHESE
MSLSPGPPAARMLFVLALACASPFLDLRPDGPRSLNVAIIFSGSSYTPESARFAPTAFRNFSMEVNPVSVLLNDTNPRSLIVRLCDVLSSLHIHGVVFEDDTRTEAVAQILDFISAQTSVPIIGINGGSAIVLTPKVRGGQPSCSHPRGGGCQAPHQCLFAPTLIPTHLTHISNSTRLQPNPNTTQCMQQNSP